MLQQDDLDFLKEKKLEATLLAESLHSKDYWAKPFYSNVHTFKPNVDIVFIGVNPGGNRHSEKYYKKYKYEEKIWSGNYLFFNSYIDERWGSAPHNVQGKGKDALQIAVKRVFKAVYGSGWKDTLRDTACFNLIPVNSKNTKDPNLHKIWCNGVDWSIELLKLHLKPKFIILYGNDVSKNAKSVWRILDQRFSLVERDASGGIPPNFSIRYGVIENSPWGPDVSVLGLPHLSHVKGKNLDILCQKLRRQRTFP